MEEVGIYFNSASKEIFARSSLATPLPESEGWAKVSDDPRIRLLAVRELLAIDGFVDDPRPVDWYGTNLRPDDQELTELLAEMSVGASCFLELSARGSRRCCRPTPPTKRCLISSVTTIIERHLLASGD